MKLLIITAIKEDTEAVSQILKSVSIPVFSVTNTVGIKNTLNGGMLDEWFSHGEGQFDSVFIFCFTTENNVSNALVSVERYNQSQNSPFPIRAFVLAVEQFLN
jgi:hypothetical protein